MLRIAVLASQESTTLQGIIDACARGKINGRVVVFLGGYMKRLGPRTLAAFPRRILNTHPALLPKFGGWGMYGGRVFEAVLAAGESESGASVHLVDAEYDTGPVIRQLRVPVLPEDTVASLRARVQACERDVAIATLAAIASGDLEIGTANARERMRHHAGSTDGAGVVSPGGEL